MKGLARLGPPGPTSAKVRAFPAPAVRPLRPNAGAAGPEKLRMPTTFYEPDLVVVIPIPERGPMRTQSVKNCRRVQDGASDEVSPFAKSSAQDEEWWLNHLEWFNLSFGDLDSLRRGFNAERDSTQELYDKGPHVPENGFPFSGADVRADYAPCIPRTQYGLTALAVASSLGFGVERVRGETVLIELSPELGVETWSKFGVPNDPSELDGPVLTALLSRISQREEVPRGINPDGTRCYCLDDESGFVIELPPTWKPGAPSCLGIPADEKTLGPIELEWIGLDFRSNQDRPDRSVSNHKDQEEWEADYNSHLNSNRGRRIDALSQHSVEGPIGTITLDAWGEWIFTVPPDEDEDEEWSRSEDESSTEFRRPTIAAAATIACGFGARHISIGVTATIARDAYALARIEQLRDWLAELAKRTVVLPRT